MTNCQVRIKGEFSNNLVQDLDEVQDLDLVLDQLLDQVLVLDQV